MDRLTAKGQSKNAKKRGGMKEPGERKIWDSHSNKENAYGKVWGCDAPKTTKNVL